MPTYEIQTEDGRVFQVDAPSEEAAAQALGMAAGPAPRGTAAEVGAQAGRGVFEGLADLGSLAELVARGLRGTAEAVGADPRLFGVVNPAMRPPQMVRDPETQRLVEAPSASEELREFGLERFGESETPAGTAARGFTRGATAALATAPLFGAVGPAVATTETLAGGVGGGVAELIEEQGGGLGAQLAGSVPASLSVSGIGRGVARNIAGRRGAQELGQRAAEAVAGETGARTITRAGTRQLTRAQERAASELKRRVGDEEIVEQAAARLQEGIEAFPEEAARPSTTQMLAAGSEPLSGQNLPAMERALAQGDVDFATALGNRAIRARQALVREQEALRPQGGFDDFIASFDEAVDTATLQERALWDQVPFDQVPTFDSAPIVSRVAQITDEATDFGRRNVPPEFEDVTRIWGEGAQGTMRELQALRSQLLRRTRAGRIGTATAEAQAQGALAAQLLDAVNDATDTLARESSEGVGALQAARAATRRNRELFDTNSSVIKAAERGGTPGSFVGSILRAAGRRGARTSPVQEAQRLTRILGGDEAGMAALRGTFLDDVFKDGISDMTARTARKRLNRNLDVAREILGDEGLARAQSFLRRAETVKFGTAGTPAAAFQTGSNLPISEIALATAEAAVTPFGGERVWRAILNRIGKDELTAAILRGALLDPALARDLLVSPAVRATPAWQVRMAQRLVRNGVLPPAALRGAGELGE